MTEFESQDTEVFEAIQGELVRQQDGLEMIASENYTSQAVMAACGSILTNKYAEGYPRKRYYGGCEWMDVIEQLAIDRAQSLFQAEYANVQPHSGSSANMAVYLAAAAPQDTLLGMDLSCGGHLTHGSPVNFSGICYNAVSYGLHPETHRLDYDEIRGIAKKCTPRLLIAGHSAYPQLLDFAAFRSIADEVGAFLVVDMAHFAGLVAGDVHPSPFPHADFVTTTTHKTLRGPRGGMAFCKKEHAKKLKSAVFPGLQGGPLGHIIAGKAVALKEATTPGFQDYAKQIVNNAQILAETLIEKGLALVTGGTANHLILIDLTQSAIVDKDLTGKQAEDALGKAHIIVNKNTVPGERRSPFVTSGVRIGTPALTTRGMKEPQMQEIGEWIALVLQKPSEENIQAVAQKVRTLCADFPIY